MKASLKNRIRRFEESLAVLLIILATAALFGAQHVYAGKTAVLRVPPSENPAVTQKALSPPPPSAIETRPYEAIAFHRLNDRRVNSSGPVLVIGN